MSKSLPSWLARNGLFRLLFLVRKVFFTRSSQRYFGQYGEDIVLDRVLNLRQPGFFVDVGCYHPVKYNNTYKLYRLGWRGVNIDLDAIKIQAFNLRRPGDVNVLAAVSDTEETVQLCSTGFYTVTQTIDPDARRKIEERGRVVETQSVTTRTLTHILDETRYRDRKIDVLSVDVEGHELPVLRSLDFARYQPVVIIVEMHARRIEDVLAAPLYSFLRERGYALFNWTGPSLLFLHSSRADG